MDDLKFIRIYRFIVLTTVLTFVYIFCVSFLSISNENKDNIKTVLIFLLGYLSGNGNYLTGGNPKANSAPQVTQTGAQPVANVTPSDEKGS